VSRQHSRSRNDTYDAIVVGGGLGGLSTGACLARAGRSVLLVERQDGPGGNARAFRRGPYTFDPAIHVIAQGFNIEFLDFYLSALGVRDRVDLLPTEDLFGADIAGSRFRLPIGLEALTERLTEYFPGEAAGIRGFVETCAQATRESQAPPPRVALKDLDTVAAALPTLFRYRTSTLADVLDEFLKDPEAKAVCGAQWPYLGLPPSRISFMAYSGALMALTEPGPLYPRGGFQALADALEEGIRANGGELMFDTTVTKVSIDGGRAAGVVLDDGRELHAPVVISNADARQTFEKLVGVEHLPEPFTRRLARMKPSLSAFLLYSAATLDPSEHDMSHETFVYRHWDHDRTHREILDGGLGGMWLSFPTMHDRSLAPEGEHLIIFTALMPSDIGRPWPEAKEHYTELMLAQAEAVLPGYRDSITFVDSATPATFEHYTLAHAGAAYGWENTPSQTVPKRLDYRTPLDGLFLAGHWTHPGTGSVRCLLSGAQTAAAVLDEPNPIAMLGSLPS
jgi:phytoene desaturase